MTSEQARSLEFLEAAIGFEPDPLSPEDEWLSSFQKSVLSGPQFQAQAMPLRENIVGDWFRQGDLGFIFAPRGVGKTWLAMHLAVSIAEGKSVWTWDVPKSRSVLYVDGEMSFGDTQRRLAGLAKNDGGQINILHHEQVFHETGKGLNLTDRGAQQALLRYCLEQKTQVLFLDNLSCLFSGVKENDADAWELVLPWLLELRRNRIAVVFVHHAGRNGAMRGTSRREDAAFWVIQLAEAKEIGEDRSGARFVSKFAKNRNTTDKNVPPLEWCFSQSPDGTLEIAIKLLSDMQLFRECIENGLTSATDIAEEMAISKGQVSKLAKKAMLERWLTKDGRDYKMAPL